MDPKIPMSAHFVYILQSNDGKYYTGYTTDLDRRMAAHKSGKGAKFTRAFGFKKLLYHESHPSKSAALKREAQLKKLSRVEKKTLMMGREKPIVVNDTMQKNYRYYRTEPLGKSFPPDFKPELTPKQMLALGVFGGKYMTDCQKEFPKDWFKKAKLCSERHDPKLNFFGVNASQPLSVWRKKGWIHPEDPRGWFQWYCRYYMGRRLLEYDDIQIKRWKNIRRHMAQIKKHCRPKDIACRPRQRQALLHWAYDSRET